MASETAPQTGEVLGVSKAAWHRLGEAALLKNP